ncbi:hypothetical protein TWF694_002106 [Orbilia ellipsospora]|uniref:F-box domain-containing protein n=1 Tax=Orbilia ellipsospora TaxID=2528407 RepID=A0AAV9X4K0_9PEZI
MGSTIDSHISSFPTELLANIFNFVPWQDHIACSLVSPFWLSIFLAEPVKSTRYVLLDPQSTPAPCPRIHNLFCDVGLESIIDTSTSEIRNISFVRYERECYDSDEEREGAKIDITNHPVVDEPLFHFQGWRHEDGIREENWNMGLLLLWHQRGYEFGGLKDREIRRQEWFTFRGSGGGAANDISSGNVDIDVTVRQFIEIIGRHVLRFRALRKPGQETMKLRMGLYNQLGVIVVRNVQEAPQIFELNLYPLEKGNLD